MAKKRKEQTEAEDKTKAAAQNNQSSEELGDRLRVPKGAGIVFIALGVLCLFLTFYAYDGELDTTVGFLGIVAVFFLVLGFTFVSRDNEKAKQEAQARKEAEASGQPIPESSSSSSDDFDLNLANPWRTTHIPKDELPTSSADLDGLLQRTNDLIPTLRDLVNQGLRRKEFGMLPKLLGRAGVMEWENAPRITAGKLRSNNRWWLDVRLSSLDDETYDRVISTEAALNVNEDLIHNDWPEGTSDEERIALVLANVAHLEPVDHGQDSLTETVLLDGAEKNGEWACRMCFADSVENLSTPFRTVYSMQSNVAAHVMCVDIVVPGPSCMGIFARRDEQARSVDAQAYAIRLAALIARMGFQSSPAISCVYINCHGRLQGETILSLEITRNALDHILALADADMTNGLPEDEPALRIRPDGNGWLASVTPFVQLNDELVSPPVRFREPELDDTPCKGALRSRCGAHRVSDLGINEKAVRVAAWNSMAGQFGSTTQDAVSRLVKLRDSTSDITVAEACERTIKALVDGNCDVSDKDQLSHIFVDGGALAEATAAALSLSKTSNPESEDLEQELALVENALAPLTEMGAYLDNSETVYRYFNSMGERIRYNLTSNDGDRTVRLVPDEYYNAHVYAARLLFTLNRTDEALPHAEELMRIAPVTPEAALVMAQCLENQSRIFEAADVLKEAITYASSQRDQATCLYRLAYMEWRLGRSDLAIACYQRSIDLSSGVIDRNNDIATHAEQELKQLLTADESLTRPSSEEAVEILKKADIPFGDQAELASMLQHALVACTDANVFVAARPLAGILVEIVHNDALVSVVGSLAQP